MWHKIFSIGVVASIISMSSNLMAAPVLAQEDRLSALIQTVEYSGGKVDMAQLEKRALAKSAWTIRCWVKVFDHSKICTMQKDHITVIRLNEGYSVSVADKPNANSKTALRVDNYQPIYTQDGLFRDAVPLIEQFKKGNYLYTRLQQANEFQDEDSKVSLLGFTDAFQDMQKKFEQLERKQARNSL